MGKILSSVVLHCLVSSLERLQLVNEFISEPMWTLVEDDIPGASLDGRDLLELHVVELKRWLKCRGANQSGCKADLI